MLAAPTIDIGSTSKKTACANSTEYPKPRTAKAVRIKQPIDNIQYSKISAKLIIRFTLMRNITRKSFSAKPLTRFDRSTKSHGTPSTQWLADDQKTASTIQNQRLEKLRVSISAKMVSCQFKSITLLDFSSTYLGSAAIPSLAIREVPWHHLSYKCVRNL